MTSPWKVDSAEWAKPELNSNLTLHAHKSRIDGKPRCRLTVYLDTEKGPKDAHIDMNFESISATIRDLLRFRSWLKRVRNASDAQQPIAAE